MIEWTNDKVAELIALLRGVSVLLSIGIVAYAYAKTRSFVVLLGAALTAGFFLWTINNTDWWQQKVDEESAPAAIYGPPSSSFTDPSAVRLTLGGLDG